MHAGSWSAEGDWGEFGISGPVAIGAGGGYPPLPIQMAPIPFWLPSMWRAFRLSRTKPLRVDLPFYPHDLRKIFLIYYLVKSTRGYRCSIQGFGLFSRYSGGENCFLSRECGFMPCSQGAGGVVHGLSGYGNKKSGVRVFLFFQRVIAEYWRAARTGYRLPKTRLVNCHRSCSDSP